jgi:hypothetical protein
MALLKQGIVENFEIFELAELRVRAGREIARKQGLEAGIQFFKRDAFEMAARNEEYDLVH